MAKVIKYGILAFVLLVVKECRPIPLPGVRVHEVQDTDSSFFLYPALDFHDTSKDQPSFRDIIPKFNNTILEQLQKLSDNEMSTTTSATIENQMAKLLDKLYGSYDWRSLLQQSVDNSPISTTYIPLLAQTTESVSEKLVAPQGFYGTEISGNLFNNFFEKQEISTQKPNSPNKAGSSKFMMKIVGSRQYASTDSPSVKPDIHMEQIPQWGSSNTKDTYSSLLFIKDQNRDQIPPVTMSPPSMSMTQKPLMGSGGVGAFDPNRVNSISGGQSQYLDSGTNNFSPNQANNGELFRPNSAFNSFITQTGSDPSNQLLSVSYNADAVNERYMADNANGMHHTYSGGIGQTVHGNEQNGYKFSAYSNAQPQVFDANSLNQALMENSNNMQQQPMGPMFPSESGVPQPTEQSYRSVTHIDGDKESPGIQKGHIIPQILPVQETISPTTPKSPNRFNFIPGNLFPGQSIQMAGQPTVGLSQEASRPEFLRRMPIDTGSDAFNPNTINAAQAVYNPNALSWIRTRDTTSAEQQFSKEIEEDVNNAFTLGITTPSYVSTANIVAGNNDSSEVSSTSPPVVNGKANQDRGSNNTSDSNVSTGFDPNVLNSNQGRSEFIPGQISHALNGYMTNPYSQGQGQAYIGGIQNTFSPNSPDSSGDGGAKMTFNIAQLLGMNIGTTGNDKDGGHGQNTASFNPNVISNMMTAPFGDKDGNSTANTDGFGIGFIGTGFDPNAANQGFSNLLGVSQGNSLSNQSGNMGGYGGFDPNAANVGFGDGGFGMGSAGTSGGYMAAFDPNKVNQMAIQNPFEQGVNDTGSGFGYFLGISSGNGQGQNGAYTSAYISAFNPDSVNQASYDPNKYNQVHLHLDPMNMLIKNPGIDKDTLKAAASAFDPDRLNSPNMQQALSPIEMLSANAGIDKTVLSNLKYDPYAPSRKNDSAAPSASQPSKQDVTNSHVFDPVALMAKLMQGAGAFQPGNVGGRQQSLDPSSMFGGNNGVQVQPIHSSIKSTTPIPEYTTVWTQALPHSSVLLQSSASPSASLTPVTATTMPDLINTTVV